MGKSFFLLFGLVLFSISNLFGQEVSKGGIQIKSPCAPVVHPLVVVDGFETDIESMAVDPKNIESITILKNGSAIDKYGAKAKDGAIVITIKPGCQFYRINDFVDASKNLNKSITKIRLNGKILTDINKLLIDKTALPDTNIFLDHNVNNNCDPASSDTLVINTQFADKK